MPKLLLQTSPAVPVSKAPAPTTVGILDTATGSQRISLSAQAKTLYRLVDAQSGLVPKNQKVLRAGKKLIVQIDGVTAIEIDNFFPENGAPASASADGAAYVVDTSATPTPAYGLVSAQSAMGPVADGNTLVWSQGMAAAPLPEGLGFASQVDAVASSSAIASGADGGALLGGLAAVAGGIAAAAGGKGAEAKPVPGKVAGSVFAGPVIGQGAVAGLKVEAFTDKGVSLGSTIVKADGTYELTLSAVYQGPLIIKVFDDPSDNITPKYLDEATQSAKTFDTPLLAIVNYNGSDSQAQTVNVTPLTTIAAVTLGISTDKPEFVGAAGAERPACQTQQASVCKVSAANEHTLPPAAIGRAEQRSGGRIRAGACLSAASLRPTPGGASSARHPAGARPLARLFFAYFLLAKQKKVRPAAGAERPACQTQQTSVCKVSAANEHTLPPPPLP